MNRHTRRSILIPSLLNGVFTKYVDNHFIWEENIIYAIKFDMNDFKPKYLIYLKSSLVHLRRLKSNHKMLMVYPYSVAAMDRMIFQSSVVLVVVVIHTHGVVFLDCNLLGYFLGDLLGKCDWVTDDPDFFGHFLGEKSKSKFVVDFLGDSCELELVSPSLSWSSYFGLGLQDKK